jgi:hypothetical protein
VTQVGDEYLGQSGPCVSCGQTVTVGTPKQPSPVSVPAKAANSSGSMVTMLTILGVVVCGCMGLVALLLPGIDGGRRAAPRMQCGNNFKQIALALHNYHDTYKSFPPAYTVDDDGNKLHSWRTLILPFIEQGPLYSQIDLNSPWDSPQNRRLSQFVIPVYGCPSNEGSDRTKTSVMAIVGPGTIFEGADPIAMKHILDGTSNTILVVEVKDSTTNWMEPRDLDLESMTLAINAGPNEIGSHHPGGAQVALGDGSVRFIPETIESRILRLLITRNDGEVIPEY